MRRRSSFRGLVVGLLVFGSVLITSPNPAWGVSPSWPSSEPLSHDGYAEPFSSAFACTSSLTCELLIGTSAPAIETIQETSGVWASPVTIGNISLSNGSDLTKLSCWSRGNCMAVVQPDGREDPTQPIYTAEESNGRWGMLTRDTLTPANGQPSGGIWVFNDVSCVSPGWCALTMTYAVASASYFEFDVQRWSNGAFQSVGDTGLSDPIEPLVSCWAANQCEFFSSQNISYAVNPTGPSDWHTLNSSNFQSYSLLHSASCLAANVCTVVGEDQSLNYPIAFSESGSTWTQTDFTNFPTQSEFFSVSCTQGFCGMSGEGGGGGGIGIVGTDVGDEVSAHETDAFWELWGIACVSSYSCTILGSGSENRALDTVNYVPLMTATMPREVTGRTGQSLSIATAPLVSGGAGQTSYSIGSGSLPPGLSLNTSLGTIEGKPTKPGHFAVALVVNSHGPPTQTVTIDLSFSIAKQPVPSPPTSLPKTGSNLDASGKLALGSISVGIALAALARRRSRASLKSN